MRSSRRSTRMNEPRDTAHQSRRNKCGLRRKKRLRAGAFAANGNVCRAAISSGAASGRPGQDLTVGSKESSVKYLEPEVSQPASERIMVPQGDQAMRHPAASETVITKPGEGKSSQRISMPAAVAPSDPSPAQVVIDRLEIEVVPPPPQTASKPPAKSEPGMEAARPQRPVSKIGPLSQSTAFRHYLSLRYR